MNKLKSRKLWLALLGSLASLISPIVNGEIPPERGLEMAAAIIVSYVLGQGYVDAKRSESTEIAERD